LKAARTKVTIPPFTSFDWQVHNFTIPHRKTMVYFELKYQLASHATIMTFTDLECIEKKYKWYCK
jgi:hypothetical protein